MLRRREWARVHPGVYVAHTGPLSWPQRAWSAVLLVAPAALSGSSALHAHGVGVTTDSAASRWPSWVRALSLACWPEL